MTFKPYVKRPLFHDPRGDAVLASLTGYMVKVRNGNVNSEGRTTDPGQALAALRVAKAHNISCAVYAVGTAYSMETLELVDEDFLLTKIGGSDG